MKETGIVTETTPDEILVSMNQNTGCASCLLAHCCQTTGTGKRQIKITSPGHPFQKGDNVEIETQGKSMLTAAFFVFILPIIIASLVYTVFIKQFNNQDLAIFGFFAGFALAEGIIFLFDKIFGKSTFFQPQIIKKR